MADPSEAPAPGDNGPAVPQPDISALLSMLQQGPSDAAGAPPPQSAHAPPAAADFYDPLAGAPPAAPPNAFAAQPRADGSADEYRFNPHHKVHFSSPPSVMFSLPNDSRLFVGNLASEKTSPEELARIFAQYGDIYEVSLKESYGFVQYDNAQSVVEAIRMEQGRVVAGLKMDLSVAKNRRERRAEAEAKARDPPGGYRAGGYGGGGGGGAGYGGGYGAGPQRGERRSDHRDRPYERERTRGRNRADSRSRSPDRDRHRGRSWSPGRQRGGSGYGSSGSPLQSILGGRLRLDVPLSTSEFPLPRRYGTNVPEVQIVAIGPVDKQYVQHVENKFRTGGMNVDVLFYAPSLRLEKALLQFNYEGVRAVVFAETGNDATETVTMLIFDGNTGYVEYDRVALDKAVGDMRMQKMGAGPIPGMQPQATPPGMPPAGYPPARPPQPTGAPAAPGLNLDMNALNSLLGAIQGGGAQRPPAGPYGAPAPGQAYGAQQQHDIGSLLSAIGGQARPPAQPVAYPAQSGYGPPQAYPSAAPQAYPSAGTAYPSAPPAQQTYYGQQQQQPPAVGGYGASPPQRGGYGGGARGGGAYRGR